MTRFGYTLMTEQSGPRELVRYAMAAEEAGFDFAVISDHYSPWLREQGHAPNAWVTLGAVASATRRMGLMTFVTCPTMRYHPVVVAQQAATLQILADGRFTLGLGSGENLNEHVVGQRWPGVRERHERLAEATEIIRALFGGETVTRHGKWFQVDTAKLWDLPEAPVPLAIAVSGERSVEQFAPLADEMVSNAPTGEIIEAWHGVRARELGVAEPCRVTGQVPICWDPDRDTAIRRAHEQFRWSAGGWEVNTDLPTPAAFDAAAQFVRPEDVAGHIPCGPDLDAIVEAVQPYRKAGFTDIAVVQVGDEHQEEFLAKTAVQLLAKLRDADVRPV
ncbi:TIGR03557 family F420-dependent LLM class oxidoreductase [Nocardia huaxiensis]|uniref:TIGR03557 family F420-dependent LLM class oxidoreductase n=1 Tax=Nocardia huaxiensis TaxID=2755382 RepID=A0A7D6ZIM2_9NOCA|nr:TIGR03557 family F420-dependent LLM class oxidoreductase [Nocardia huaxiensis]QLY34518.1 TIGR03557 family F420-dependent LLM class oxidoreductase [Nocardia huaxiensis]